MADSRATEDDANLRSIEGINGPLCVRPYTCKRLSAPTNVYMSLVACSVPCGSNNRYGRAVDELVSVTSGRVRALIGDEKGDLCPGRLMRALFYTLHRDFSDSLEPMKPGFLLNPTPPGEVRSALFDEDAAV